MNIFELPVEGCILIKNNLSCDDKFNNVFRFFNSELYQDLIVSTQEHDGFVTILQKTIQNIKVIEKNIKNEFVEFKIKSDEVILLQPFGLKTIAKVSLIKNNNILNTFDVENGNQIIASNVDSVKIEFRENDNSYILLGSSY